MSYKNKNVRTHIERKIQAWWQYQKQYDSTYQNTIYVVIFIFANKIVVSQRVMFLLFKEIQERNKFNNIFILGLQKKTISNAAQLP